MNKLTYIEKIALFRILFDIVNADKIIHEKEIDYLKEIANSLNLVGDYEKDVKELTSFYGERIQYYILESDGDGKEEGHSR